MDKWDIFKLQIKDCSPSREFRWCFIPLLAMDQNEKDFLDPENEHKWVRSVAFFCFKLLGREKGSYILTHPTFDPRMNSWPGAAVSGRHQTHPGPAAWRAGLDGWSDTSSCSSQGREEVSRQYLMLHTQYQVIQSTAQSYLLQWWNVCWAEVWQDVGDALQGFLL